MQATRYKAKDASIKTDKIYCFDPMFVQHPLVPSLPCDDIIIKNAETAQYSALSQLCIVVNMIHRTQGRNNHNMEECIVYNIVYSMYGQFSAMLTEEVKTLKISQLYLP